MLGQNAAAAEEDTAYREMFDKDGRFNRDLAKEYLDKEDYEQVRHVWLEVQLFIFIDDRYSLGPYSKSTLGSTLLRICT